MSRRAYVTGLITPDPIYYFWGVIVRKKVQARLIETPFVKSQEQIADILTKALDRGPFEKILVKLGSIDIF
jgi:hypothetical protein